VARSWLIDVFRIEITLQEVNFASVPQQVETECGVFVLEFAYRLLQSIQRGDEIPFVASFKVWISGSVL
jgi:hypothetical protein